MPRNLKYESLSLETLWDELVYTEALLLVDEDASEFAPIFSGLVEKAMATKLGQLSVWRSEIVAQAHISLRNYLLDSLTTRFHRALVRTLEDAGVKEPTSDPRYKSYFVEPLSRLIGRGLETQLPKCKDWPIRLAKESEKALQDFAPLFEEAIQRGQTALDEMVKASGERKSHRTNQIIGLFEEANTQRKLTANHLSTRGIERKRESDWADSFFRKDSNTEDDPVETKQRAIVQMLSARGLSLNKEERTKIFSMDDPATLERWCAQAGTISNIAELFS